MDLIGPSFLHIRDLRLLLFSGKGGVGKTTCATATALHYSRSFPQGSFLLVSIDPAHSLADSIDGSPPPENLKILELDAKACLASFKMEHSEKLREIAWRGTFLDDDDIERLLDHSLPGLDELMAFIEISRWLEAGSYDCIIVDTAPTGHTLRLLAMPELIREWLTALDALLAKQRYLRLLISGSYRQDEPDAFLLGLSNSAAKMEALLRDPMQCRVVPVTVAERLSLHESISLLSELERFKILVRDIVVNMLHPQSNCPVCADEHARQVKELWYLSNSLSEYCLWGIPLYRQEIQGVNLLETFWECASPVDILPAERHLTCKKSPSIPFLVTDPATLPSPKMTLLLFAGKGGVGKTTLACATAIHLAQNLAGKEVLLFSTDPAHSLSACLDVQIGPEPTRLIPGLTALEIDSQAEFEGLKAQYREELERFLCAISPDLDLVFDGEAMERIIDLSPPGLDEVMALTRVTAFLAQGQYDVFILDAAPTGHLVRLLELPELVDQWLKVFFNLFLKYRRVFRLPKISRRLVQMSKDLKELRSLLNDPERSALVAVTIPTEMAFQETRDLVAACERMGVCVPLLFVNRATPMSECSLCSTLFQMESQIKEKLRSAFPNRHQVLVHRQGVPLGLQQIGLLGQALYKPLEEVGSKGYAEDGVPDRSSWLQPFLHTGTQQGYS